MPLPNNPHCLIYLILIIAYLQSTNNHNRLVHCLKPSTVFVLETSESPSQNINAKSLIINNDPVNKRESVSDSNTRIITDDADQSNRETSSQSSVRYRRPTNDVYSTTLRPRTSTSQNQPDENYNQNTDQRNKYQESVGKPNKDSSTAWIDPDHDSEHSIHSQRSSNTTIRSTNNQTRLKSGQQSSSNYGSDDQTVPKTEERLLISITNDDDNHKQPHKQIIASDGGFEEFQPPSSQQQQQQQQKKKPAITISIQDNSKQSGSGSSNSPSVILRPSENGQSIVISTVGASSIAQSILNDIKFNGQNSNSKPTIAIVSANPNHHNDSPYREPVESQSVNQHHSTTHRPSTHLDSSNNNNNNHDYNPPANKPITSSLVDQVRPPLNVNTQRPSSLNEDSGYEHPVRPTPSSRPTNIQDGYNEQGSDPKPFGNSQQGESRYPLNEKNCGTVHDTRIVGGEEAEPDEFLWMAAIIKSRPRDGEARPFCGGSLITRRHILTAAHCLENLAPRDVLVRLGGYDFDDSTASSLSADFAIDQFRVPAQYSKKTHVADIAIMRLKTPLQLTDNYKTVCMPQPRRSYVGALGTVTGYGSQSQTFRRAAVKLRQVTVPIWENRKCSAVYKKNLTESFLCAGYEDGGKDACQGDSGGPLMTEGPSERMMIVGVVSHGIGCGAPGYPGVYTRTSTFLDWIEKNTKE